MQDNWTNFHSHTVFSMLDGHGQVENYAERANELGMTHLAITDHGNLHGWMDFYDACQEMDLTPIMGMEAYMARKTRYDTDKEELSGPVIDELDQRGPYHLTVVARNFTGYQNLIKLSSRAFLEGVLANKARIDHELLSDHADGLMIFSGCLNGPVAQAIMREDYRGALEEAQKLQDIVGKENFFIEVMDHTIEEEQSVLPILARIAEEIGAKVVPTGDCHYVRKEDSHNHDVMLCQPAGTQVLRAVKKESTSAYTHAPVAIEDIAVGDRVVSWSPDVRRGRVLKSGDKVSQVGTRHYKGTMISVHTDDKVSSYTYDHICVARMDSLMEGEAVYMMRRGNQYRIGTTGIRRTKAKSLFGISMRCKEQGGDAMWIISIHATKKEALLQEALLSHRWNIPTYQFQPTVDPRRNTKTHIPVSEFWESIGSNFQEAKACLEAHGRDVKYPIWEPNGKPFHLRRPQKVRACNLMDGMLVCDVTKLPPKAGGSTYDGTGCWVPIRVERTEHEGTVYSIEVENRHTYIADGIVTHNCVSTGSKVQEEDRFKFVPEEFYLRSYDEMLERFPAEWLHNSMDAASMVERYDVPRGDLYFPEFKIGTGESPEEHFERLVWEGIENRYGSDPDREVIDRTLYEIRTIKRLGFTPYFLVVADLINHGKSEGVRIGYGRGSAAGSIVSYALNITNLDPLRFGLLFERFLLPEEVDYDPVFDKVY